MAQETHHHQDNRHQPPQGLRIAMWSGPRNISTAMLRAFENREDTAVEDEPLYAYYLATTGIDHPGREEIIAAGDPQWQSVVSRLTGPIPDGKTVYYQKHMTHHLLPEISRDWLDALHHVFLIRDPAAVARSYVRARPLDSPEELGLPQQAQLFDQLRKRSGEIPPVIDAEAFLAAPREQLEALCQRLSIPFSQRMLNWPPGPRASDGIWAKYWYAQVWESTGFARPRPADTSPLPPALQAVVDVCEPHYRQLLAHRI